MPMDAGREHVIDRRSYRTAAEAAGTYCTDVHDQQLPAIEPGDLLYTELVYAGRLTTAQWWTADSAGLREITEARC
ncbi:MAG: hypothetical protein ABI137_16095 [Antricoccus sp.]